MQRDFGNDIKALLNQVAEGDEQAFQQVFESYKERFYAASFKMTHSADDAEEIVQEAFISIWIKRKVIALAEKPESYIFTILRNCIYAHFRKIVQEHQRMLKIAPQGIEDEDSIESRLIEKEENFFIESAINKLPPRQRMIYQLAKREGISREEIAKKMGISPNTVRNHLAAAIDFLRSWFKTNESALCWFFLLLSFHNL